MSPDILRTYSIVLNNYYILYDDSSVLFPYINNEG